jgi:Spy/CpxP family protein refolding chaperone
MLQIMTTTWHGTCSINNQMLNNSKENIPMKKIVMTLITVIAVTAFAASAFAFGPGWGRGHGGGQCNYEPDTGALSKLNLTDEQTAKMNTLRETHLKDVKPLQDKMFSKRGELRLLWLQQKPDEEKIIAVQKEIRGLRDAMQDKMTVYRLNVLKVLTPEQQEKVKSSRMGHGFGPGMRGGEGMHGGGPGPGMMRGNW